MGFYLNSQAAYTLYQNEAKQPYFIDKSGMLEELFPLVETGNKHICLTRPRRFGKTIMANMIASFFCKACDAQTLFDSLAVSQTEGYEIFRNKFNVVHISFNDMPRNCRSYEQYISRIENRLIQDLQREFPDISFDPEDAVWDAFLTLYMEQPDIRFIFVLDEWDFIFHQDFVTSADKKAYLIFLRCLLKDRPYVCLTYMTGILPIAKYSSGSELNMFLEYTMTSEEKFSNSFGFSDLETDILFERYLTIQKEPKVTREGLRIWYDGYHTKFGGRVYNPRSVVASLTNNNLGNYWTSSGPYDEIFYYVQNNIDSVRDDLALMVSGEQVPAKIQEYAATSQNLETREEIFSAMAVYGFLSYDNGFVCIPNKELMDRFSDMLLKESSLGYVHRLAKESDRMLKATLAGDTQTMSEILSFAHNTESPLLSYNSEAELTAVVNLVYLQARDYYRIEREDKAGTGYVDFIFYPQTTEYPDGIILELKVDHTAKEALAQIRKKKYFLKFKGRPGESPRCKGRIIGVGISYSKKSKIHECKTEVFQDML